MLTEVGAQGGCSKAQGNTLIMLAPKVGQTAASIPHNNRGNDCCSFLPIGAWSLHEISTNPSND